MTMIISGSDGVTFPDSTNQFSGGAFSFKNRLINGGMVIDQRNAGASVTFNASATQFVVDRFGGFEDTDGEMTGQQDSSAPAGFVNSVKLTTTTADASLSATQRVIFRQNIEGQNVSDLGWGSANAKTVTLSFWTRSSLTGTHGGAISNNAQDRSYPFTYTISVADTWEYKTITIAGDTTGTWLTTNGIGIRVIFGMGVGSTYSGTAGAWAATRYESATGAVSVIGTLNATWYVTGVQLEVGSVATPFERRPFGLEFMLCQRYYQKLTSTASGQPFALGGVTSSTAGRAYTQFMVIMRAAPSALETNGTASDYSVLSGPGAIVLNAAPAFESATVNGIQVSWTVASGATTGYYAFLRAATANGGYLAWSAEL
jgi:hypothetical protein